MKTAGGADVLNCIRSGRPSIESTDVGRLDVCGCHDTYRTHPHEKMARAISGAGEKRNGFADVRRQL